MSRRAGCPATGRLEAGTPLGGGAIAPSRSVLAQSLPAESPFDVEPDVEIVPAERSSLVGAGNVLIDLRGVVVGQQDLEEVASHGLLQAERPADAGVASGGEVAVDGNELAYHAEGGRDGDRKAHRGIEGVLEQRAGSLPGHNAACIRDVCRNDRDLGSLAELVRENRLCEGRGA